MADENAAAGADRQPFDVTILREIAADFVGRRERTEVGVADGQPADLPRRADVALDERRRGAQHVGDVVEPFGGIIRRQHRGRIDVDRHQVADDVGVFVPIQAVQAGRAGIRLLQRGAIDGRFDRPSKAVERRAIGARRSRRRHQAGPKLPEHLFPDFGVRGRMIDVDLCERQTAGLQPRRCGR